MAEEAILSRVQKAPEGMIKVNVNAEKLQDLASQHPESNLKYCEKEYGRYFEEQTNFMLKSGNKFPASTLYINPMMSKEDAIEYAEKYGAENFNKNSLHIDFAQHTNDPDHCTFFAMKEAGLKNIPVYMNKESYELAEALGLLAK